jgi:hypothetical protein
MNDYDYNEQQGNDLRNEVTDLKRKLQNELQAKEDVKNQLTSELIFRKSDLQQIDELRGQVAVLKDVIYGITNQLHRDY